MIPRKHPAKFSIEVLNAARKMAAKHDLRHVEHVLDPFAGVGRVFDVFPQAVGIEIEPGWACADSRIVCGDTLRVSELFPETRFGLIFTSPCYGNRMADHHNNQDSCKGCDGEGCARCDNTGLSRRHTYRHYYGEDLTEGTAAVLQWGNAYRDFHERAWAAVVEVMADDGYFMLNISDHIRGGRRMPVEDFHRRTLVNLGLVVVDRARVSTKRQGDGANGKLRVASEGLFLLRRA